MIQVNLWKKKEIIEEEIVQKEKEKEKEKEKLKKCIKKNSSIDENVILFISNTRKKIEKLDHQA